MNIHEHQAKAVLKGFGVPVSRGEAVTTPQDARKAAETLGSKLFVVKSQIHAGGRGKGKFEGLGPDAKGGVRLSKSADDVFETNAKEMLGRVLVTAPDRPQGQAGQPPLHRRGLGHREASSTCRSWWTARPAAWPWSLPPRAAWTSRRWPTPPPSKHHHHPDRPRHRRLSPPWPRAGRSAEPEGRSGQAGRQAARPALHRLRGHRHEPCWRSTP